MSDVRKLINALNYYNVRIGDNFIYYGDVYISVETQHQRYFVVLSLFAFVRHKILLNKVYFNFRL